MKKQTNADKFADLYTAWKHWAEDGPPKRSGTKDGSIATHPVVPVTEYLMEYQVLHQVLLWLHRHDILCNRNNVGAGQMGESGYYSYGIKDAGDIVGLLPTGRHFEIEVKRGKGGRLSKGQQKRMYDIRNNGGIYLVVHGVEELAYFMRTYL